MKEAAGEANLTVVAIILIAVVVAVATPLVNSLMSNATYRSCCTDAGHVWSGGSCQDINGNPVGKDKIVSGNSCVEAGASTTPSSNNGGQTQ